MRKHHLTSAALLVTAGIAAAAPAGASAEFDTKPTNVLCTTYNAKTQSGIERIGYNNTGIDTETIAAGDLNYIDPYPENRSQPERFMPGNGSWDTSFSVGDPTRSWYINGLPSPAMTFNAADLPFNLPCAEAGPSITSVAPVAIAPGSGAQRLTVIGQNLKGTKVSVSGDGVSVADPSATTEQRVDATITVASGASPGARDVLVTTSDGRQAGCRGCLLLDPNAQGTAGPKGDTGPQGPQGPAGKDAVSAVTQVTGTPTGFQSTNTVTAVANCPAGTKVISGGYEITGTVVPGLASVVLDRAATDRQWAVTVRLGGARSGRHVVASATCLG